MLERNENDYSGFQCKITGKRIEDDFYMFPAGYICLPQARVQEFINIIKHKFYDRFRTFPEEVRINDLN